MNKINTRIAKWDNFKLLLIITVVLGHLFDELPAKNDFIYLTRQYIYIFHMPAFIFVSGLFSKKTVNDKNWFKIFPYLVLYFVVKYFIMLSRFFIKEDIVQLKKDLFFESGLPWFMLALFVMYALTFFTSRLNPKLVLIFSIFLSVFAGYSSENTQFLAFLRIINYYPFFYAGYVLNPKKMLEFLNKAYIKVISVIFLAVSYALLWVIDLDKIKLFVPLLTGQHTYDKLGNSLMNFGGIFRLMLIIITSIFILSILSLVPAKENILTKFGERTLSIYILHYPIIDLLARFTGLYSGFAERGVIVNAVIFVAVAVCISLLCGLKIIHKSVFYLLNSKNWIKTQKSE